MKIAAGRFRLVPRDEVGGERRAFEGYQHALYRMVEASRPRSKVRSTSR